jgi:hypothetical protein
LARNYSFEKNENNYLQENDRWRNHLRSQLRWVSTMWLKGEDWPILLRLHDYDTKDLQGLGVISTENASYWTFSFYKNPDMKHELIRRFNLIPFA